MPWRVGRDFRHLSQAAYHFFERSRTPLLPIFVFSTQLRSTRGGLWLPAVAFKFNHSHAPANVLPEEVGSPYVKSGSLEAVLRWDLSKEGAHGSQLVPVAPPPEILSVLNVLFTQYPRGCTKLDLRLASLTVDLITYLRHPRAAGVALYFLETKDSDRAFWVLRLSIEMGFTLSCRIWPRLVEKFAESGKWDVVLRLINIAVKSLNYTTTALLNWRLQALIETRRYITLEEALAMFEEGRVRASKLTYHLLVSMHLRNSDLAGAISSMRAMESAGFHITVRTCAVVVLSYRSLGLVPSIKAQAVAALDTVDDRVSNAILNGLIQLLLDAEDMPGVVDVLSSVSRLPGDLPSDLGADTTRVEDALSGVSEDAADPQTPRSAPPRQLVDITTYNVLLHHLGRRGDLPRALHVLQQLRSTHIAPDSSTAAALVRLYFAAGHPNDAFHVLAGVLVKHPAAAALLPHLGFVEENSPEHPIPPPTLPTIHIFNALLGGTLRAHGFDSLRTVLSIMRIANIDANATTCTILLSYALRRQRPRYREMIRTVRSLMLSGVKPTLQHLHALLDPLLRDERAVASPRGWKSPPLQAPSADSNSSRPTSVTSPGQSSTRRADPVLPIAGFTLPHHRRYSNLLRPIFQSLTARKVRADRATFAMRIKHDALVKHDTKAAHDTFRMMVNRGIQPNWYHYGALMEGYAAEGNLEAAANVMNEASAAGVKADVKTHTILIAGYARLGQPTKAVEIFRSMIAKDIRPDVPAIDALVSAFFRARLYAAARRVLMKMWSQVAPFPVELADSTLKELAIAFRALHFTSPKLPERLSAPEQRKLKRKMREILQTWTGASGKVGKRLRYVGNVITTRRLQYIRTGC